MKTKTLTALLALLLAGGAGVFPSARSWAQPTDVEAGRDLARHWCAGCHQVEAGGALNEVAPSFLSIANDPTRTPDYLWAWLSTSHPLMPDFNLTYLEIRSLIAYLESLREAPE